MSGTWQSVKKQTCGLFSCRICIIWYLVFSQGSAEQVATATTAYDLLLAPRGEAESSLDVAVAFCTSLDANALHEKNSAVRLMYDFTKLKFECKSIWKKSMFINDLPRRLLLAGSPLQLCIV